MCAINAKFYVYAHAVSFVSHCTTPTFHIIIIFANTRWYDSYVYDTIISIALNTVLLLFLSLFTVSEQVKNAASINAGTMYQILILNFYTIIYTKEYASPSTVVVVYTLLLCTRQKSKEEFCYQDVHNRCHVFFLTLACNPQQYLLLLLLCCICTYI
ncbi:hypothetical protein BDB00DRAFT_804346 [Zychaea mexicana]|uniref:uncharacterized protein n=1 Tax=Zychaea mexicana TaxID=64656 RepID=UPI0022FF00D9|nr:uncharacterized protein BDB00DRAFT_804346 [Zychaea mexicana]KAI9497409.1 hypothetical protein BDB00DRAFT_804346 [Zychaea mexicana]